MSFCVVVGAGDFFGLDEQPGERDLVIAADGGYRHLMGISLRPDIIIGDFDSAERPEQEGAELILLPKEKDETDTAAAVRVGEKRGYWNFHIYGGTGGRMAHTMANIQLMTHLAEKGKFGYLHDKETIATVIRNTRLELPKKNEGYVSVFALSDLAQGVSLRGLKYELEQERLNNAWPLGVSNEFSGRRASVEVRDGTLLVIWSKDGS
ncbi:MAG: thiamine diphosphokinase [Lachnospiraceae bacterium]|nr:thiamine diphosphokinase [Lachnospiraceae bacterium]